LILGKTRLRNTVIFTISVIIIIIIIIYFKLWKLDVNTGQREKKKTVRSQRLSLINGRLIG